MKMFVRPLEEAEREALAPGQVLYAFTPTSVLWTSERCAPVVVTGPASMEGGLEVIAVTYLATAFGQSGNTWTAFLRIPCEADAVGAREVNASGREFAGVLAVMVASTAYEEQTLHLCECGWSSPLAGTVEALEAKLQHLERDDLTGHRVYREFTIKHLLTEVHPGPRLGP